MESINENTQLNEPSGAKKSILWAWILVLVVLLLAAAIRMRCLQIPLERDEGEFAYMGQLMLKGIPPYEQAYNMKFPGIYAAYALIMLVFGQTIGGVHFGLLVVNAMTIVFVFLLAKRLFNPLTGVAACACYAVLSMDPSVFGLAAHATHFVVLFALPGIMLLLNALESGRKSSYFWSGLLLGTAILMKQSGVLFFVFAALYLIWNRLKERPIAWLKCFGDLGLLATGCVLPFLITCLILFKAGVFKNFWFWTFDYARAYGSIVPLGKALVLLERSISPIIGNSWGIWMLAGFGIITLMVNRHARPRAVFILGLFLCSFISVCLGFIFRNHYFVQMLPVVAILAGVSVDSWRQFMLKRAIHPVGGSVLSALLVVFIIYPVINNNYLFFRASPEAASRSIYGINPFPESVLAADYIAKHSDKGDTIAIFGSEPQIFFYSGRHSATGYIYIYSLLEDQKYAGRMQREMIAEVWRSKPKYLLFINASTSWLLTKDSDKMILDWAIAYIQENYKRVGVVDRISSQNNSAVLYTSNKPADNAERSSSSILIFRRISSL